MRRKHSKKRRLPWSEAAVVFLVVFCGCLLFLASQYSVMISLHGEPEVTVELGERYTDEGADACLQGPFLESGNPTAVTASGKVDTQKVGIYKVAYTSHYLWYYRNAERTVRVVDTEPPVIQLVSEVGYVLPGGVYREEGYTATDNCDGDITDKVVREERDGMIIYRVQDSSGNQTEVQRKIVYSDPIPPELILAGESEMTLTVGDVFTEQGYTATDNCDGDLTDQVTVSGSVDTFHAGTYFLKYTVTDHSGNLTTVYRKVTVQPVPQPEVVDPGEKVIYLTFDDGPGKYTEQLLDILKKYDVKVTFFVIDSDRNEILKRMVQEGHSVGIHSALHQYRTIYASEEAYFEDLNTMRSLIREQTGLDTTLLRFPGGSSNTISSFNGGIMSRLTKAVTDMGYQYFDWNVDSNDAGGACTPDQVFQNVVRGIGSKKVSVVLQHDVKDFSVEAVERIITWGLENGYTFLPLEPTSPVCHHSVNN